MHCIWLRIHQTGTLNHPLGRRHRRTRHLNRIAQGAAQALEQCLNPVVVEDGVAALEALHNQPFDLALMDIQMPLKDGLSVVREYLGLKGPGHPPTFVALTANAMEEDKQKCFEAGMAFYLRKPFSPEELLEVIGHGLTSKKQQQKQR